MNWATRKVKVYQRQAFFDGVGPRYSYLTLPGADCMDIQTGRDAGVLTNDTHVLAVEREQESFDKMCDWFVSNWPRAHRRVEHCELSEIKVEPQVDLCFLDYLGNLTIKDAYWIKHNLVPNLLPNANIGITTSLPLRGNRFIPACESVLKEHHAPYFKDTMRLIRDKSYPPLLIQRLSVYAILISVYFMRNYTHTLRIDYYREQNSPYLMFLFRIANINYSEKQLDSASEAVYDSIDGIVKESQFPSGIIIRTTIVPPFFDPQPVKDVSSRELMENIICATTTGQKAAATRRLNKYIQERASETGKDPKWIKAGILANVTRVRNKNSVVSLNEGK